jgi:hypothetical protein
MALDTSEFFFENQMEETSVKLADTRWGRRYVHGILTTSQHHLKIEGKQLESISWII